MEKKKKPFYKKWWFWGIIVIVIGVVGSSGEETPQTDDTKQVEAGANDENNAPVTNVDAKGNKDSISTQPQPVEEKEPEEEVVVDVPTEYKSALKKAKTYSDMMHMSKEGLYDQLTSEYGEKFSAEAAQYAIDNLEADYNENALKKAQSYQETMAMSPSAIYDQLISEYGEKFTPEEAQYAIDNLD